MRATFHALTLAVLPLALLRADDPPQLLPVYGGAGGTSFSHDCGARHVLTGLRYRTGLVVDAVGILCRPVNADGSLGPESTVGTISGGTGGTTGTVSCPAGKVIVLADLSYGSYVSYMALECAPWSASLRKFTLTASTGTGLYVGAVLTPHTGEGREQCESSRQPASGIRGRAAAFVDALGLVCDEP
ncbi:hypothetical protein J421_1208 [Gemmatirosa kalamazoonensis]|jgi:hypothetical protein|uniref:Uncharacterized protein n=1 Tax=Gemmatirosa kalamazoonensis TaxID=861299 RepID=W0REK0_9BACT|nr:hypothetical protein [Gemmatirosa kalamazoonensis]AHG88745.1 hypothetical protein J421_1208 [Gemmatirosa kalamazoonensis]